MVNYNNSPRYDSSNRAESDRPHEAAINTRRASAYEVAYRNGYTEGRRQEQLHHTDRPTVVVDRDQTRVDRDRATVERDNSAVTGLLIGILLTSIIGAIAALFYLASREDTRTVIPIAPAAETVQPQPVQEQPTAPAATTTAPAPAATTTEPAPAPNTTVIIEPPPAAPEQEVRLETQPSQTVAPAPTTTTQDATSEAETPAEPVQAPQGESQDSQEEASQVENNSLSGGTNSFRIVLPNQ